MFGKDELNYIKNKIKKAFPYLQNVGVLKVSGRIDTGTITLRISILCDSIIFNENPVSTFSIEIDPSNLMLAANKAVDKTAKQIATNIAIDVERR